MRSEIVAVLVAGLLRLPAMLHKRREAVVGDIGERARRLGLLKRRLHLLKLRPGLRELVVNFGRRNDSKQIIVLDPAADIDEALRDVSALAGVNCRRIEGLRRRRKMDFLRRVDRFHLLDAQSGNAIPAVVQLPLSRLVALPSLIHPVADKARNRQE